MKKYFTFLSLILIASALLLIIPVFAEDTTPSADLSEDAIKANIKDRLEKVVKNQASGSATLAQSDLVKRAWVGTLEDISGNTLSVKTRGGSKQIEATSSSKILDDKRQSLKLTNLEIGSHVIAMGYLNNQGVLDTRRLVVSPEPPKNPVQIYLLKISSIKNSTITATDISDSNQTWQISLSKKTVTTTASAGNLTEIVLTDFQENDRIIVVGKIDPKTPSVIDAARVHLLENRAIISQPETATGSATTSPTPRPSPKPSPSAND